MHGDKQHEYPSIQHRLIGYPYRVWIFSIIITPLISILLESIEGKDQFKFTVLTITWYFLMLAIVTAMSAPSMAIYMLAFWKLINSGLPAIFIKLILFVIALTCIWLTSFLLSGEFLLNIFSLNRSYTDLAIYSALIFIFSFSLSIKEK